MAGLDPAIHQSWEDSFWRWIAGSSPAMTSVAFGDDALIARQFNTLFASGLSSENAGTSISNRSPVSLTIM